MASRDVLDPKHHPKLTGLKGALPLDSRNVSTRRSPETKETKSIIVPEEKEWRPLYSQISTPHVIEYIFNNEEDVSEARSAVTWALHSPVSFDTRLQKYILRRTLSATDTGYKKLLKIDRLRKKNKFGEIAALYDTSLNSQALLLQSEEDGNYNILTKAIRYGENPPVLIKTIIKTSSLDYLYGSFYRALHTASEKINILTWVINRATQAEYPLYIELASDIIKKFPPDKIQSFILSKPTPGQSTFHDLAANARLDHFEQLIDKLSVEFLEKVLLAHNPDDFSGLAVCIEDKPQLISKIISKISQKTLDQFLIEKISFKGVNGLQFAAKLINPHDFILLVEKASAEAIYLCLIHRDENNDSVIPFFLANLDEKPLLALVKKADPALINTFIKSLPERSYEPKIIANINAIKKLLGPEEKSEEKPSETKREAPPPSTPVIEDKEVNPAIQRLITENRFDTLLSQIHLQYRTDSRIKPAKKPIEAWNREECKAWADEVKKQIRGGIPTPHEAYYYAEMIAVLMRATKLHAGYIPRDVQIVSLLLFLQKKDKRRLAQIATGEGKSLIVAMLAVMKALQGEVVDIVTSSPVLAARDAEEMKDFYAIFGLTVADNWDEKNGGKYTPGYKACYSANIVYGDPWSFHWDFLRQHYLKEGTRGSRPQETAISDEVDCLLVDQFRHGGELLLPKPAMEYLNLLFIAVWQELVRIEQHFGGMTTEKISPAKKILKDYLTELITGTGTPIYIPPHLKEWAIEQMDSWIDSAFDARYRYVNGKDYIILKDKDEKDVNIIACVDYSNTGVLHTNMVWKDGLHQFLQIKHQFIMFPEAIFSPQISNLAFFNRYTHGLYGMTGTLGSTATQDLLKEAYSVDLVFIPTFKIKRFTELPPVVCERETDWLTAIITSVTRESTAGKPVLLICESINEVEQIEAKLAEFYRIAKPAHIKRYARNDTSEHLVVSQKIEPGQIIIATNLAGRGTDIRPDDKVEAIGGLHVCLVNLPNTQRVEDQAFGRTSRQGKSGTGQLIINREKELTKLSIYFGKLTDPLTLEQLKKLRDEAEVIELQNIKSFGIKKVTLEDTLFSNFCQLRNELFAINDNEYVFSEIEDRYGLWLKKQIDRMDREKKIESEVVLAEFEIFKRECFRIYRESDLRNPAQLILDANATSDYEKAIRIYSKAIELDPIVATQGYFNRAFARLSAKSENAKELAQADLLLTKRQLQEHLIPQLQTMHILRQLSPELLAGFSDLTKQIQAKIQFYEYQIQYIDNIIKYLQEATTPHFEVREKFGKLSDICRDLRMSERQFAEIYHSGMKGFYELEAIPEEENDSLWGLLGVALLGVLQIVAGVAISLFQPAIGTALLTEGVGDILFAVRGAIDGRFSWDAYRATKTTSMAISIISLGINIIRNGLPPAPVSATTITKSQFIRMASAQVTKAVITSGIKQTVGFGLDFLTKEALNHFEPEIEKAVNDVVRDNFNRRDIQVYLDKLFAADLHNRNVLCATKLKELIRNILQAPHEKEGMALTILKGILANQHSGLGAVLTLTAMGNAITQVTSFTQTFCSSFNIGIKLYSDPLPIIEGDYSRYRTDLCNQISSAITKCILAYLHKGVAIPTANLVVSKHVDRLADNIQRACNPFLPIEEKKSPEVIAVASSKAEALPPQESKEVKEIVTRADDEKSDFNLADYPKFPLLFKGEHGTREIKNLTQKEIRQLKGDHILIYVITDRGLIISSMGKPENRIQHIHLANKKPVYCAGNLTVQNGKIISINNTSGGYRPTGDHLDKLVTSVFTRKGYSEVHEKFNDPHKNEVTLPIRISATTTPVISSPSAFFAAHPPEPSQSSTSATVENKSSVEERNKRLKKAANQMLDNIPTGRKMPKAVETIADIGAAAKGAAAKAADKGELKEHVIEETVCRLSGATVEGALNLISKLPGRGKLVKGLSKPAGEITKKLCHNIFATFKEEEPITCPTSSSAASVPSETKTERKMS